MAELIMTEESSTPATPSAGKWKLYPKADGWYAIDDAGNETGLLGLSQSYIIATSIATNNLTVALKHPDGSDPSAASPLYIRINGTWLRIAAARSVAINASYGDVFSWDGGKIQANDAQLFVYLINNNGDPQLGVSPCPTLTTVATNYRDVFGGQTGVAGHTNIVMNDHRDATNSCDVIGRVNVNQADNNNWQAPTIAKIVNRPIYETDILSWTPTAGGQGAMTYTATFNVKQYQILSDKCKLHIDITGTTGGTANLTLNSTLPIAAKYTESTYIVPFAVFVYDTSFVAGICYILNSSPTLINFGRYDLTVNFGLGAGRRGMISGEYKVS
jgi:hypothetical protein